MRVAGAWGAVACAALLAASAPARDLLSTERARLAAARAASRAAAARATTLDRRAAAERDAAGRERAEEAAVAARIARAEADLDAAHARVAIVDRQLADRRATLGQQEAPVARLLAALASLARRPAVAAVVQPGSLDDLVHVRAVFGATLPVVRERTVALRGDLARTRMLQAEAAQAAKGLRDGRLALIGERRALAALQVKHQAAATSLGRSAIAESDRAIAAGEAARDIVDRMTTIGETDATLEQLRRLPGPPRFDAVPTTVPPAYRLPVAGRVLTGMGEISDNGVRARGLAFAAAPGAVVVAPAAGRVVFAGGFRSFAGVVIVDHGSGWTTLLSGLGTIAAKRGETVRAGQPIGRAGPARDGEGPRVAVELRRRGRPIDITALVG